MSEWNTEKDNELQNAERLPETVASATDTIMETENKTPVFKKIITIFSYVLLAFSILMVIFTVFASKTFDKKKEVFGVKMYVVLSDSMKATDFAAGDLVFAKVVDPTTLQEGDIISFISQNKDSYGQTITHKIRRKTVDENGNPGFITYGTTKDKDDAVVVTYEWIEGEYVGKIPFVGRFFHFLKKPIGYVFCILLPFAVLIAVQGWNCFLAYKEYRGEKTDKLKQERERLQKEKEENQRVLEEMRLLKEELRKQKEQTEEKTGANNAQ